MRSHCPSEEQLLAFHLGTLPEGEVDALSEHVERCSACEETLQRLESAPDPLLAALRKPVPPSSSLFRLGSSKPTPGPDLMAPENWPELPNYEILATLGRGGMGVVYKARHLRLNRLVALKRFRSGHARELGRSHIEAEALSRLQHSNIVQIHEIIEHDGETFLALELVHGGSLGAKLHGKPQPPRETASLLEAIARAVDYAHRSGIIHRDLKPANILLKDERKPLVEEDAAETRSHSSLSIVLHNSSFTPKITDFGVAKRLAVDSNETREGDVIGTPAYMAPEQATGKNDAVGPTTDVYSLGVILYELLTGRVPLQGPSTLETLLLVRSEEPVPPRRLVPRIPRDLETICLKCLEKEPGRRYATAESLANDLHHFLFGEPIEARPTPAWERVEKWVKRRPVIAGLSAALVLVTVLGFILVAWQWRRAETVKDDEILARKEAQDNARLQKEARLQIERISAGMTLTHGVHLCETGQMERGLLWIVRALECADRGGDAEMARAARCNLAAWQPFLVRERGEFVHGSWVLSVAFSPDGRQALSASVDYTVQRHDPATAKPMGEPLRHPMPVLAAAYSPDSKKILTVCGDITGVSGQAHLWDAVTGKELRVLPALPGDVARATFSPDGQTFLVVCTGQARIWRTDDGEPVGQPFRHPPVAQPDPRIEPKVVAALRRDGTILATAGEDGTIRFWEPATGQQKGEPLHADGPVTALAFSPDGKTVVTGTVLGAVQMWNMETGEQRGPILRNSGQVRAIAFTPDGECFATGGAVREIDPETQKRRHTGGEVRLWRVASGQQLGGPLPHSFIVWSLAFSPQGRILLTGSEDGLARFFVTATGQQMGQPLGHPGNVLSVAMSPDGKTALTASAGGGTYQVARFWNVPPEEALGQQLLQGGQLRSMAVSPDSRYLVTGSDDGLARFWDLTTSRLNSSLTVPERILLETTFSPDGQTLMTRSATDGQNGRLRFWDTATKHQRQEVAFNLPVHSAVFSPDDRAVVVSELDNHLQRVTPDGTIGPKEGMPVPDHCFWNMSYSPEGRTLLTRDWKGFQLWDSTTFQKLRDWPDPVASAAHYYPDGKRVLLVTGGFPHCWSLDTGRELSLPRFHADGGFFHGAFSPNGRRILTVSDDRVARIWDVTTGMVLGPPIGREGVVRVAVSPDGRRLATGSTYGRIVLWNEPPTVAADFERLRVWIEGLTGLQLDSEDSVHSLSAEELEERRRRLEELGGPPTIPHKAPSEPEA